MGLRIWADETMPRPRPLFLELTCDGDHGFLPVPTEKWEGVIEFLATRQDAADKGWLIGSAGRVLCAACRMAKR